MVGVMTSFKDLTHEPPRRPHQRLGDYVILARTIDKGRAFLNGKAGEYHFDCPLDNMLFGFKGVKGDALKQQLQGGATDEQVLAWLNANGAKKTPAEIRAWSDETERINPYNNPERKDWFKGECEKLGLDPAKTTLFGWLEADDRQTFKR